MYNVTTRFLHPYQTEEIVLKVTITIALGCLIYHATRVLRSIFFVAIIESKNIITSTRQVRLCIRGSDRYNIAELKALKRIEALTSGSSHRERLHIALELKVGLQTHTAFENIIVPVLNRIQKCPERLLGVEVILPPDLLPTSSDEYSIQRLYEDEKQGLFHLSTGIRIGRDRCAQSPLQNFSWNGSLMWLPPQWAGLSYLGKCNNLSTLALTSCHLSVDDLFQILCHCRSLITMKVQIVSSTASVWTHPLASPITQETHPLEELTLFSSVDLTFFFLLVNLMALRYLDLDFSPVVASGIDICQLNLEWEAIERFYLSGPFAPEVIARIERKFVCENRRFEYEQTSIFDE